MNETTRTYARIALVALIIIGAGWVLAPFIAALLFAAILCLTTWPLFAWIEARVKGRTTLAALLATLILATAVLVPMAYLTATIADGMARPDRAAARLVRSRRLVTARLALSHPARRRTSRGLLAQAGGQPDRVGQPRQAIAANPPENY